MNPPQKTEARSGSYDLRPGNGEGLGLLCFRRFKHLSLTYLLRHLLTYLQLQDQHGAVSKTLSHKVIDDLFIKIKSGNVTLNTLV